MEAIELKKNSIPEAFLLLNQHLFKVEKINTIGCDNSCSIQLNVNGVEPRHARIEYNNEKYIIKDLRSKSGVFINDTKIIEAELSDGDFIKVGSLELTFSFKAIILEKKNSLKSKNQKWQSQLVNLPAIAENNFPVVLIGQSGSGKDVVARQIHKESLRQDQAFVSINCSALSPQLIESELFGHIKGAFTGADCDRKGAFMKN